MNQVTENSILTINGLDIRIPVIEITLPSTERYSIVKITYPGGQIILTSKKTKDGFIYKQKK